MINPENTKLRFLKDIERYSLSLVYSKWLIDRTPFVFYKMRDKCLIWKEKLAEMIGVDSHAILIMGSASLGFSLNPNKNYKLFSVESDVDVAIVSHHYFDVSWHCLRSLGSRYYKLSIQQKAAVEEHRKRLIYWGTVATDKILPILPFAVDWMEATAYMSRIYPTIDREINIRLYKDFDSLRAYQLNNLQKIKDNLFSTTGDLVSESIPQYNS